MTVKTVRTKDATFMVKYNSHIAVEAHFGVKEDSSGPCFTLSGSLWRVRIAEPAPRRIFLQSPDTSGQITEEILQVFPWLTTLSTMHMAQATTGEPLHAEANGWFHFTNEGAVPEWKHFTAAERAASYLRASPDAFVGVETQEDFKAAVERLRPIWKMQADAVRATYEV